MSNVNPEDYLQTAKAAERLYTKKDVDKQKTASGIGGIIVGVVSTLFASVVLNKVTKINVTDKVTGVTDAGIKKIKGIGKGIVSKTADESSAVEI
jgi:hypothetical protein